MVTPHALDQQVFELPDGPEEELGPSGAAKPNGTCHSSAEAAHEGRSVQVPQYTVHYLHKNKPEGEKEQVKSEDEIDLDTETHTWQNRSDQEPQQKMEHTQNEPVFVQVSQHSEIAMETLSKGAEEKTLLESLPIDSASRDSPVPSSPVHHALNRAKRNQLCRVHQHSSIQCNDMTQILVGQRGGRRGVIPIQRSSSLPSSLFSPSRVVSSVKIQFRKCQASCTQPKYSFKYTNEAGEDVGEEEECEEEEKDQSNCLSTLIINPGFKDKMPSAISPKPIPPYLLGSSCSLQSVSTPLDQSLGDHVYSWSTQSVPDLPCNHQSQPSPFQLNMSANQSQQSLSAGQMFPTHSPSIVFSDSSHCPSPVHHSNTYPFSLYPYVSFPYHPTPSLKHYSSMTSLHQPLTSPIPQHGGLPDIHHIPGSTAPYQIGLGHLYSGTHQMHYEGYNHPHDHQFPYHLSPHSSQFASPYHSIVRYNLDPHLQHLGFSSSAGPVLGSGCCPSSTEMQLRRVLHGIRGAVQSLGQVGPLNLFTIWLLCCSSIVFKLVVLLFQLLCHY